MRLVGSYIHSSAAEIFAKPRAVGTARLFECHRPQSTSTNLERIKVCPRHTPLEQGFTRVRPVIGDVPQEPHQLLLHPQGKRDLQDIPNF
ncbi:hypothetical protein AVEN_30836-1 [Araneus ventricosus]|uniref:Uncharacterized protein n=1 Tax=Araneus ventricosus TaxID=182803 RepID=A0A4Y2TG32_ARAVE|nr:hypothetical protein AVEN_30836-1 [Araneus ventricosus]